MRRSISKISGHMAALIFFTLVAFATNAQNSVKGHVTDAKAGYGLQGVTVTVKGTKTAVQTDVNGNFSIVASPNATLVFTSAGYGSSEVAINHRTSIEVPLTISAQNLSEVVIIGYGTTQKKDLTGAITQVSEKDFQKGVISTPEQLIAGKVAGVSIISNGGQPGQGSTIRIRGGSSLRASNDPLIVIDGVPLDNPIGPDGKSSISGASNPLSFINANDIESFTVLKDASAAAIYGTRAANGVIIITTKKGKGGALKVNFSTLNSISEVRKTVAVLSAKQVRDIVNEKGTAAQKAMLGSANTDWQNEIYQKAFSTDNNISFSGGIKGLPYRISLGYLNQDGILKTDNLQKNSVAFVLNPVLFNNTLKVDINLKASQEKARFANQGAIGTAVYFDPTQSIYSDNKRFGGYFEFLKNGVPNPNAARNPLALLNDRHDNSDAQRSIGNIQLDYKFPFFPDLHANLNLGYDMSKGTGTIFVSDSSSLEYATQGEKNHYKQTKQNTLSEFYLNYVKDIHSIKSHVDVLAGYSYNNYQTKNFSYPRFNARGEKVPNSDPSFLFDIPEHTLISYFGRANYFYNDKYLLTATIRSDASSRFSPSNRWGLFPSVALAWKIKDETFLKNSNAISQLKLRAGYGITGQQEGIANYSFLSYYALSNSTASYQFGNNYYQMFRPGGFYANRKWEETATTNVGLDYGFFGNRISGTLDFYIKKTSNLLNEIPQPAGTNFSAFVLANVGDMENKGIEFSINAEPVKTKDFSWDVSYNITYNKNTITNLTVLPDDKNYIGFPTFGLSGVSGFAFLNAVGTPKSTFYLYHQVYDAKGNPIEGLFADVNRDGIINENDKYKGYSADPAVFMGFSTNFSYKKWNAGFVLRASIDNYVMNTVFSNNGRLNQVLGTETTGNASSSYLVSQFKGTTDQQLLSDYYIENASFLKMDNLNIGYDFGKIFNNKTRARATFSIQKVFTITKYQGLDPEISSGVDNNIYPRPRMYSLGLNFDF